MTLVGNPVTQVYFNDGTTESIPVLVYNDNGGDNYDLFDPVSTQAHLNVPRREIVDYDESGGGDTWHSAL